MQNDVMVLLAKHVIATVASGSNFVFSPMSVNLLLCLIAAGSSCVSKQQILTLTQSWLRRYLLSTPMALREVICAYLWLLVFG
ncbi:unnamed protein product [Brassica rapa]|uniref:Serpin domain-containing protein n=1 Tax=Brassica campestris TaxID=3711 RepID=A0A8D9CXA9_BRACM|nr:unnamed protein product [Brassica rapa]